MLDAWLAFNGVAGAASIFGFLGGYMTGRKPKQKCLVYDVSNGLPVATAVTGSPDYRISVTYHRQGLESLELRGVYVHFLTIANIGRQPIKGEDWVEDDPLRIHISSCRVLDVLVDTVSREVCRVKVQLPVVQGHEVVARLRLAFFDYQDGLVLRLLTDEPNPNISVAGTIIGMPAGVRPVQRLAVNRIVDWLTAPAVLLSAALGAVLLAKLASGVNDAEFIRGAAFAGIALGYQTALIILKHIRVTMPPKLALPEWTKSDANRRLLEAIEERRKQERKSRLSQLPRFGKRQRRGLLVANAPGEVGK